MGTSLTLVRGPAVHVPLDPSTWSCSNASSSDKCFQCVLSCLRWRRVCQRDTSLFGPSGHGESRLVCVCSSAELFFPLFPSPTLPLGSGMKSLPLAHPEQGLRELTSPWRKPISTFPLAWRPWSLQNQTRLPHTHCRRAPALCEQLLHGATEKQSQQSTSKLCPFTLTLGHSPHCPLLKMWTESGFYLISDLVQAPISSISGTISVMNCRWSY